jgi:hypothetical protein
MWVIRSVSSQGWHDAWLRDQKPCDVTHNFAEAMKFPTEEALHKHMHARYSHWYTHKSGKPEWYVGAWEPFEYNPVVFEV